MVGKIPEPRLKAVPTFSLVIPLQDHRFHVVVEHPPRYPTEGLEGRLMAL